MFQGANKRAGHWMLLKEVKKATEFESLEISRKKLESLQVNKIIAEKIDEQADSIQVSLSGSLDNKKNELHQQDDGVAFSVSDPVNILPESIELKLADVSKTKKQIQPRRGRVRVTQKNHIENQMHSRLMNTLNRLLI